MRLISLRKGRNATTLLNATLVVFLIAMILANIASSMENPLMSLYLQSLGANVQQVGLFFTLTAIVPLVFQILGGFISDSIGRLQAIAIGSTAGFIGYIGYVLAPSWKWLLLAQGVASLAFCFVAPSFQAFVAEQSSEETRGRVFSVVDSMYMVVGVIGPPLGGYVSKYYGYRVMFVVAAVLYGSATVIRIYMARKANSSAARESTSRARDRLTFAGLKRNLVSMASMVLAGGVITWLFISDGIGDVAYSIASRFEPLYYSNIIGLDNTQIGSFLSAHHLVMMALLPVGGWFADRVGERAGIVLSNVAFAAGFAVFLAGKSYGHFMLVWIIFGIGASFGRPAYNSLISKVVPLSMRGTAFGLFTTSLGLVSLPAPYIGGLLWNSFGPKATFVVPFAASLVAVPLLWVKLSPAQIARSVKKASEAAESPAEA